MYICFSLWLSNVDVEGGLDDVDDVGPVPYSPDKTRAYMALAGYRMTAKDTCISIYLIHLLYPITQIKILIKESPV
jgi:hypothetical protein